MVVVMDGHVRATGIQEHLRELLGGTLGRPCPQDSVDRTDAGRILGNT
jgi:hypothetical protein